MSSERGKPVHLTKGERRLLIKLLDDETSRLEAVQPPASQSGPERDTERIRRVRLRQYRRLKLELSLARESAPEVASDACAET